MSLLHTESFAAFEAVNSTDDSFTPANGNARLAVAANLRRAGYQVTVQSQATAALSGGFMVRPDPVNPDRNGLFLSAASASANSTIIAAIRKVLPITSDVIVGGFSLYVPPEFVKSTTTGVLMQVSAVTAADVMAGANWDNVPEANAAITDRQEVFRVTMDLLIKRRLDAAQSGKTLVPGRINFIEYRISPTDVRVWLDDILVLQKTVSLVPEAIALKFVATPASAAPSTPLAGAAARWVIGNWYNVVEDAYAPNVRLGPTTRVIGVRPDQDVSTMFQRPAGYDSNAAVAALPLMDVPPATLQSTSVGDQDVFAVGSDTGTSAAKMIHAVAVKVLAANLESDEHTMRALLRSDDGAESPTPKPREWRSMDSPTARQLNGIARRPTDGKIFACGNSLALWFNDHDAAPDTPWTMVSDDGGTIHYIAILFRPDGWGIVVRSDASIGALAPGATVPTTVAGVLPVNGGLSACLAGNAFVVGGANGWVVVNRAGTPDVFANWQRAAPVGSSASDHSVAVGYLPPNEALPNGRLVVMTPKTSFQTWATSDDLGATWVSRTALTGHKAYGWDGTQLLAATHTAASGILRSTDAITWSLVPGAATANTQGTALGIAYGFLSHGGETIVHGDQGSMSASKDGNYWRSIPRVSTTMVIRAACVNSKGDIIAVGNEGAIGKMLTYAPGDVNQALPPLGGYVPMYSASPVNPATGAPWTPTEAAQSQFGMRLTS